MTEKFVNYHPNLMAKPKQAVATVKPKPNVVSVNTAQYQRRQMLLNQAGAKPDLNKGMTPGNRYFANRKAEMSKNINVKKLPIKKPKRLTENVDNESLNSSKNDSSQLNTNSSQTPSLSMMIESESDQTSNPLLLAQLKKAKTEKKHKVSEDDVNFKDLTNDVSLKPHIKQLAEIFTKIGDKTQSSLDLIDIFKLKTNEIISFFSTISNQKNHIEDLLLDIITHLSAILRSKGNIENIDKLNKLLIENTDDGKLSNLNLAHVIKQWEKESVLSQKGENETHETSTNSSDIFAPTPDTMSTHDEDASSELVLDLINNAEIVKDKKEESKIIQSKIFGY